MTILNREAVYLVKQLRFLTKILCDMNLIVVVRKMSFQHLGVQQGSSSRRSRRIIVLLIELPGCFLARFLLGISGFVLAPKCWRPVEPTGFGC